MADYDEDRRRSLDGPTELRVHGVGGTPPENLLRDKDPVLVAGTTTSGFYRRKREPHADWQLEAYSWGGLTSGGGFIEALRKALWLLLLPFTAMNAAGWMMPVPKKAGRRYGWGQRLLRWLAQFATVGLALGFAAISVDIIGLQCGSRPACTDANSWLQWLDTDWLRFIWGRPAGLMAVALLVPAVAMLVLWFISRSSQRTSEGPPDPEGDERPPTDWWEKDRMNIARPGLWKGAQRVTGLTRIHFGSAAAGVALAYAATVVRLARDAGEFATFTAISGGWAIGVLGWGVWLLRTGGTPGVRNGRRPGPRPQTWWLLRAGLAVLVIAVVAGWLEGPTWAEASGVTALDARTTFNWAALLIASPVALIVAGGGLALVFRDLWRRFRDRGEKQRGRESDDRPQPAGPRQRVGGCAELPVRDRDDRHHDGWLRTYGPAWMTAFLGAILGVVFLATLALWAANTISSAEAEIDVWVAYEAVVVGALILLLVAVGRLIPHLIRLWRNSRREDCAEELDKEFHADLADSDTPCEEYETYAKLPDREQGWLGSHERWVRRRVRERRIMQYTADRAVEIASWVTGAALVLWVWALVDIGLVVFTDTSAGFGSVLPAWGPVVTFARWLLLLALGAVFALVADSYRNADDRRRVAILWDVLTFWPRWFHPVTPPSYAATAVPQLGDHLDKDGPHYKKEVLLAAHSQGAVVALATVARMTTTGRHTLALLTYGNPARRLHGRFFKAYFGLEELCKAQALLTDERGVRWRNLTRCSDPIGGVVLEKEADVACHPCPRPEEKPAPDRATTIHKPNVARQLNAVDWVVPDPHPQWPRRGDPLPDSKGHSNYDRDDPYDRAAKELFGLLGVPPTPQP